MTTTYAYRTNLRFELSDSIDAERHSVALAIRYTVYPGCEPTREQPGEGPSVSIKSATIEGNFGIGFHKYDVPDWLWPALESDESLEAELLAHAAEQDECARDQAADAKREEQMLERGR